MASVCPQCRVLMEDDVLCCAELAYTWKCDGCHKVSTGFAIPYGKCNLCGGQLKVIKGLEFDEPMTVQPIRDAVQFELDSYHFYRLALTKVQEPTQRAVLEQLYQHEVDHLQMLEERYHTHLPKDVLSLTPKADALLAEELFDGIDLNDPRDGPLALYEKAIAMERRTRDHFHKLADTLPAGPERDVCHELAAEEDEHVAMLETEREQFRDNA